MFAVLRKGKLIGYYNEDDINNFDTRNYEIVSKAEYINKSSFLGIVKEKSKYIPIFREDLSGKNYISNL